MLGKLILGYLMEDLAGRRNYSITLNKDDKRKRKSVQINVQKEDGTLSNDITQLSAHIALAPIQTTSIYKQQLVEIDRSLKPVTTTSASSGVRFDC